MSLRQALSSSASQSGYQYLCSVPDKCQVSSAQGNYPRETEDDSECCHSWVTWGSCSNLCSISPSDTPLHDNPLPLARPGVSSSSFSLAAVTHWILLFINHPPALPLPLQFLAWQPDTLNQVYSNPNYCDSRCPTSPIIFWKWILIKMTHQSGQLFLKEETKWDQKQLKSIRLAVSFLSNCILKILILNRKYM